ncbi:MAG: hypothetical protein FVQ79_08735 [Planctomycetes bacterium]|nr:hypothetical protein [Planctomycetota bacterium]
MSNQKTESKEVTGEMRHPYEDDETIICIEYDSDDRPFNVTTQDGGMSHYDFDWCEGAGLYYHCSGGGPRGGIVLSKFANPEPPRKIWAAPGIKFVKQTRDGNDWKEIELTIEQIRAMGHEIISEPVNLSSMGKDTCNPFDVGYEGETVYCGICRERMPDEDLCRHVFWDRFIGMYSGVGSDEGKVEDYKDDILFFISKMSKPVVEKILHALTTNSIWLQFHGELLGSSQIELNGDDVWHNDILEDVDEYDDLKGEGEECKFVTGGEWLASLEGKKTKKTNALVAEWIKESANNRT